MNPQIQESISQIAEKAGDRYATLLADARQQTRNVAKRVKKGKSPVKTLSKLGLKLSRVSHKTVDGVLRQQTKMMNNQIDALADNLQVAAKATGLRDLVETQIRRVPENTAILVHDLRETLRVAAGAGEGVREAYGDTVAELRGVNKKAATKATEKVAAKATEVAKAVEDKVAA